MIRQVISSLRQTLSISDVWFRRSYIMYMHMHHLARQGKIKDGQEINITVCLQETLEISLLLIMQSRWVFLWHKLICASNDNKVLYDFFRTGTYDRKRDFILTTSPSMDILISSNLERLIYRIAGADAKKCAELMQALSAGRRVHDHRGNEIRAGRFLRKFLHRRGNSCNHRRSISKTVIM